MTPQLIEPGNNNIDVELDRLAYYAYLLTLDPDLALSVVTAAIDTSMTHLASRHDLLQLAITISLAQFRLEPSAASDRESPAVAGLLFSDSRLVDVNARSLFERTDEWQSDPASRVGRAYCLRFTSRSRLRH